MGVFKKNLGFTLAEVLITLGIIGVVASLTIPTIMQQTQDKEFKVAAKKAYSVSAAAVQKMRSDEGGSLSDYVGHYQTFYPVFKNYFKIIRDCGFANCLSDTELSNRYYLLDGSPLPSYTANYFLTSEGQFVTSDGMFFMIENGVPFIFITVDVNGYDKKPNTLGKDVFSFQIINDTLVPMGIPNSWATSDSNCKRTGGDPLYNGFGCMALVMRGIDY